MSYYSIEKECLSLKQVNKNNRFIAINMENNVMFLGSYGVGKTTILLSYINNKFIPNAISTIGMDNYRKQFSPSLTIKV